MDVISSLPKLTVLEARGCGMRKFPRAIFRMRLLQTLDVGENNISSIPSQSLIPSSSSAFSPSLSAESADGLSFACLSDLRVLRLDHLELMSLPYEVGQLTKLTELHIHGNPIVELPISMYQLKKLTDATWKCDAAYLKSPPKEVAEVGIDAIRALLERHEINASPCYRMKLVVVGPENVGKTTLLRQLRMLSDTSSVHNSRQREKRLNSVAGELPNLSTDGIDIKPLTVYQNKNVVVQFSAWDFAGQEVYYATHQFFVSNRSLYIICWDARADMGVSRRRLEFWLQSISMRVKDVVPIFLVATHRDAPEFTGEKGSEWLERRLSTVTEGFSDRFRGISLITAVSCTSGVGLSLLIEEMIGAAKRQPHIGEKMPAMYELLEKELNQVRLEKKARQEIPVLTLAEVYVLARRCHVVNTRALLAVVAFLHDLGSLLYYDDRQAYGNYAPMADVVVLDPQWLVDMLSSVISTTHNYCKKGILRHSDLHHIWKAPMFPPELHDVCLNFLRTFQISLPISPTEELFPCMLPAARPNISLLWPQHDATRDEVARYWNFNIVPYHLFFYLLPRLMNIATVDVYWRNGAVFEHEQALTKVELSPLLKRLTVCIRSEAGQHSNLFITISDMISQLLSNWCTGIGAKVCIPCSHCLNNHAYEPYVFTYEDLVDAVLQDESTVQCWRRAKCVNVALSSMVPDLMLRVQQKHRLPAHAIKVFPRKVAEGAYGDLYKGVMEGGVVAVKILKECDMKQQQERVALLEEFRREVSLMTSVTHRNLVNLKGFCQGNRDGVVAMVMEFMDGGDLYNFIHQNNAEQHGKCSSDEQPRELHAAREETGEEAEGAVLSRTHHLPYSLTLALKLCYDVACGMEFLHSTEPPIIHRDLKPPNVLLKRRAELKVPKEWENGEESPLISLEELKTLQSSSLEKKEGNLMEMVRKVRALSAANKNDAREAAAAAREADAAAAAAASAAEVEEGVSRNTVLTGVCEHMQVLRALVQRLPRMLHEQYCAERGALRDGTRVLNSPLMQSLSRLAVELELPQCEVGYVPEGGEGDAPAKKKDKAQFEWLASYALTLRAAEAVAAREELPPALALSEDEEVPSVEKDTLRLYRDPATFTPRVDAELTKWAGRHPREFVAATSEVRVMGPNMNSQFCDGPDRFHEPTEVEAFLTADPVIMAPGADCTHVLSSSGTVFAVGKGDYGRLGLEHSSQQKSLAPVERLEGLTVRQLVASRGGYGHAMAVVEGGEVYSWGDGDFGKLGQGTTGEQKPAPIATFTGMEMRLVVCGHTTSGAITSDGKVYLWGQADDGSLGGISTSNQNSPMRWNAMEAHDIKHMALGYKTGVCTDGSSIWVWGLNNGGALGLGHTSNTDAPTLLPDVPSDAEFVKVCAGRAMQCALTAAGDVWIWGENTQSQCGVPACSSVSPQVLEVGEHKVVDVVLGSSFGLALTLEHKVLAWGCNDYGQLGLGHTSEVSTPTLVEKLDGCAVQYIECGEHHVMVSTKRPPVTYSPLVKAQTSAQTLPMPEQHRPDEFPSLADIPLSALSRRFMLLRHLSTHAAAAMPLFDLESPRNPMVAIKHVFLSKFKTAALRRVLAKSSWTSGEPLNVTARRYPAGSKKTLYKQLAQALHSVPAEAFRSTRRVWKVLFMGEGSDDAGGPYNESISQMCDELMTPGLLPILQPSPNTSSKRPDVPNKGLFVLANAAVEDEHSYLFRFFGRLLGLAIRSNHSIALEIAPIVWKQLAGMPITFKDIRSVDEDFAQTVNYIRDLEKHGVTAETFSECDFLEDLQPVSDPDDASAEPLALTFENRTEWRALCIKQRRAQSKRQVEWIREGLGDVVPLQLLSLFTPDEIDTAVCGSRVMNWSLLKSHTRFESHDENGQFVRWLWEVLEGLSDEEASNFLRFVWGRARLPGVLSSTMTVSRLDRAPVDMMLPTASTCFFKVSIPAYSSKEILEKKLKYAIATCRSIDTDDYNRQGNIGDDEGNESEDEQWDVAPEAGVAVDVRPPLNWSDVPGGETWEEAQEMDEVD
eukprot:TRINITY_DN1151_c0_g1_i3.p1 TRINITY_DN1151_c0_g1~~TRINITY_DN1151_c0_g1_i3.p1  ORF type:complete len:2019 (-),score=883.98 TRINITY_DN1151_c0_g1_i3:250-6306(-)